MAVVTSCGVGQYRASEAHALFKPRIYPAETPGVLYCHGAVVGDPVPLDVTYAYLTTWRGNPEALALRGHCSLATDMGGGDTWGNATADAAMNDSLTFLRANGASDDKIGIVGGSMGGLVACNWARTHIAEISCIALIIPAVDPEDIRANNRSGYASSIEAAYGGNAAWQAARPTRNPVQFAAELASIPIMMWYSSNDPICIPASSLAFAAAHGNTTLVNLGAVGHSAFINVTDFGNWMHGILGP